MTTDAIKLITPQDHRSSALFASPHSGRNYPTAFLRESQLDETTLRSSEDAYVDLLFERAPHFGAPILMATAPRAYVDVNRSEDELDPALIWGVKQTNHNPRISSGLGVIPRVVAGGRAIRRGKIALVEAQTRIDNFYKPYHDALDGLVQRTMDRFGSAIVFDCHSMPREAILAARYPNNARPDIILGDLFGASCDPEIMNAVEAAFHKQGFGVARNAPFAGAFVAKNYGRPSRHQHVVQIEIDRSLYMNEETITPLVDFETFRRRITAVVENLAAIGQDQIRLAAE